MIDFNFETDFELTNQDQIQKWVSEIVTDEGYELGDILYIFCDDEFLHKLNVEYLDHDTLTDILSFDYCLGKQVNGEIYISVERVADNAKDFNTKFEDELHRVIIHGILHFCGYKDKSSTEESTMRIEEDQALARFKSL